MLDLCVPTVAGVTKKPLPGLRRLPEGMNPLERYLILQGGCLGYQSALQSSSYGSVFFTDACKRTKQGFEPIVQEITFVLS